MRRVAKKPPKGSAQPHDVLYIRTDPALNEVLRRHAFERNIAKATMCEDILRMWALTVTDKNDPMFSPSKMGVRMPDPIPFRYKGYVDTLGFVVETPDNPLDHTSAIPLPREAEA